jgi:hypothetical protein
VRYEDLLANPRRTMAAVLAFLGERWHDQLLHPTPPLATAQNSTGVAPRFAGGREPARAKLTSEERAIVASAAGATLDATGYRGERKGEAVDAT